MTSNPLTTKHRPFWIVFGLVPDGFLYEAYMKAGEKWHHARGMYHSQQRLAEMALGCPECGCKDPTHVQIRAEAPAHVWRCPCGTAWAVKDGRAVSYSAALPWSQQ